MTRFYGKVGYGADEESEDAPGVWTEVITEIAYYGDVVRSSRQIIQGANVNDNIGVQNSISIVADAYATENFFAIRYVEWAGIKWTVTNVEVQSPRLLLHLGEVYNGPIPADVPSPPTPGTP